MRVPFYIYIPLCILTAVTVWLFGTYEKDFMTPPTEEELNTATEKWRSKQPQTTQELPETNKQPQLPTIKSPPVVISPPPPLLPTGDLNTAPSLAEYGTLSSEGSSAIINLARRLEDKKAPQRALLAWERVIDTTTPNKADRTKALSAIKRLKTILPPWNADPRADIRLNLHIGIGTNDPSPIKDIIQEIAQSIDLHSDHILQVTTTISTSDQPTKIESETSLALWFTLTDQVEKETEPLSLRVDLTKPELAKSQLEANIYNIIKSQLMQKTSFAPLPQIKQGQPALHNITRLMWREFAHTIQ